MDWQHCVFQRRAHGLLRAYSETVTTTQYILVRHYVINLCGADDCNSRRKPRSLLAELTTGNDYNDSLVEVAAAISKYKSFTTVKDNKEVTLRSILIRLMQCHDLDNTEEKSYAQSPRRRLIIVQTPSLQTRYWHQSLQNS